MGFGLRLSLIRTWLNPYTCLNLIVLRMGHPPPPRFTIILVALWFTSNLRGSGGSV